MTEVLIGIGSNLDGPINQVKRAFQYLDELPGTELIKRSSLYTSKPQGPQDQEDYVNAVALIDTSLTPIDLLSALKDIENKFGRIKTRHWGERVIDLDILFYGDQVVKTDEPDLTIPHAEALNRDFVILPALEIAPDWRLPSGSELEQYRTTASNHVKKKL